MRSGLLKACLLCSVALSGCRGGAEDDAGTGSGKPQPEIRQASSEAKPEGENHAVAAGTRPDMPYLAEDFTLVVVLHPLRIMKSAAVASLLTDESLSKLADNVFETFAKDFGVDLRRTEEIVVLLGPTKDHRLFGEVTLKKSKDPKKREVVAVRQACQGFILRFSEPVDEQKFVRASYKMDSGTTAGKGTHEGKTYYQPPSPEMLNIHFPDPKTIVCSTGEAVMKKMLSSRAANPRLAQRLQAAGAAHDAILIGMLAPMKRGIWGVLADLADAGPSGAVSGGVARGTETVMYNLEAVTLTVQLSGDLLLTLAMDAASPESAAKIEEPARDCLGAVNEAFNTTRGKPDGQMRLGAVDAGAELPKGVAIAASVEKRECRVLVRVRAAPASLIQLGDAVMRALRTSSGQGRTRTDRAEAVVRAIKGRASDYPPVKREQLIGRWREEADRLGRANLALNADGSGSWTCGELDSRFRYEPQAIDFSPEAVARPEWSFGGDPLVFEPAARIPLTLLNRDAEYDPQAALFVRLLEPDRMVVVFRHPQKAAGELAPASRLLWWPLILQRVR